MATPDIDELIAKVNTLTLDKNKLKLRLNLLTSQSQSSVIIKDNSVINQQYQSALQNKYIANSNKNLNSPDNLSDNNNKIPDDINSPSGDIKLPTNHNTNNINSQPAEGQFIAGVECASSCEEDLLYMNNLLKRRLDEYNQNWDHLQSKCSALLSELNSIQKHYACLKKEKLELEEAFKTKCNDYDELKTELQTIVLNYEGQLSAMSEHLSMITNQMELGDKLEEQSRTN